MSTEKKVIIVTGATGNQGGSVIKCLFASPLASNKFHVRAMTRNLHSAAAKKLKESYPEVELVLGNANDKESLEKAFAGASYAFLVTNFFDPLQKLDPNTDLLQGKNMVDAAISQKLEFVVWSSLPDVSSISNNRINVPHFTQKNKVEQYIKSTNLKAAFVYAGFYGKNWFNFPMFGPQKGPDGTPVLALALRADVAVPIIDIDEDFGQFVVPLFLQPERYANCKMLAASEYLIPSQMAKAYEEARGEKVKLLRVPLEVIPLDELREMIRFWNDYGCFNGEHLTDTFALYDEGALKLHTLKDWIIRTNFTAHSYQPQNTQ